MKKIYRPTEIEFKGSWNHNQADGYLSFMYGGKEYWAQGEFYVDGNHRLHHTFITPTGKEKEIKLKLK